MKDLTEQEKLNKARELQKALNFEKTAGKQIHRIRHIAHLYVALKSDLPNYKDAYLEAYEELANKFEEV